MKNVKMVVYISEQARDKLDALYVKGIQNKKKRTYSSLIDEAIELLHDTAEAQHGND